MIKIYEVYYPDLSGDLTDSFWFNEDLAERRRREMSKPSMYYEIVEWEVMDSNELTLWKPTTMEEYLT